MHPTGPGTMSGPFSFYPLQPLDFSLPKSYLTKPTTE
jgi:hypothetical protein